MKAASTALQSLLATGSFVQADLYTFTLFGGGTSLITTLDADVAYGGNTWTSTGPYTDTPSNKATGHWKIGLDVDSWIVEISPRSVNPITGAAYPDKIGNQPWLAAARAGALDGATVQIDRAYWASWPVPWASPLVPGYPSTPATDYILSNVFLGRVSQVDCTRVSAIITINSHLELLTTLMPRNLYQASCAHQLFDAGCTLTAASFAVNGIVTGIGATANLLSATIAAPSGSATYALGRMVMTSGANAGFSRGVRTWDGTVFTLISPFPFTMQSGDAFTAYPGCDKSQVTCNKFSNIANYAGENFIPVPETAL